MTNKIEPAKEASASHPPRRISIWADYGAAYAWNENNFNIELADEFPTHPRLNEIQVLDAELNAWADRLWDAEWHDPNFPWQEFHEAGFSLAFRVAEIFLRDGIPVSYSKPAEDPDSSRFGEVVLKPPYRDMAENAVNNGVPMSWNYRVMEREGRFAIHEVYYDKNGEANGYTESPVYPAGTSVEELQEMLGKYQEALKKPILKYED